MNKHKETLIGFKKGSTRIAKEQFCELQDALDEFLSASKKVLYAVFVLLVWFVALLLICLLPLATWLRLRWEKQYQEECKVEAKRTVENYTRLNRNRE